MSDKRDSQLVSGRRKGCVALLFIIVLLSCLFLGSNLILPPDTSNLLPTSTAQSSQVAVSTVANSTTNPTIVTSTTSTLVMPPVIPRNTVPTQSQASRETFFEKAVAFVSNLRFGFLNLFVVCGGLIALAALLMNLFLRGVSIADYLISITKRDDSSQAEGLLRDDKPKEPNEALTFAQENEPCYQQFAKRYGVGFESFDIECVVNEQGGARIERHATVKAYTVIPQLYAYLMAPERDPDGNPRKVELSNLVQQQSNGRQVTITPTVEDESTSYTTIQFAPALGAGETETYQMIEHAQSGLFAVALTQGKLAEREDPFDYFGWLINRPTRKLVLRVRIPEKAKFTNFSAEVKFPTRTRRTSATEQRLELARLRPKRLTSGGYEILELVVEFPINGLQYIVKWLPTASD